MRNERSKQKGPTTANTVHKQWRVWFKVKVLSFKIRFCNGDSDAQLGPATAHAQTLWAILTGQMRQLTILIVFTFSVISLYGQTEVELYFKNDCDNSISKLEFELLNLNDTKEDIESKDGIAVLKNKGTYLLTSYYVWGDMVSSFNHTIQIENFKGLIDTLNIPKIKFTTESASHSRYWNYFNCDKLCDGLETDFYPNGRKRLEGEFKNGKPSHLTEYREDGTKETESWYVAGTTLYTRVDYFDEAGKLDEYDKYRNGKRKTIKTTYTAHGKRSGREVIKHQTEK